jgi:ABC-2 type transport system ATP-binding protein
MDHIIEVGGLTKTFKSLTAVNGITFGVKRGELFGFLGPNGAGKTTTIRMLTTLLMPSGGTAHVDGHDIIREREAVRSSIGIVFQDPSLDENLTARENLKFHGWLYNMGSKRLKERVSEMLSVVELEDRADDLVRNFSGGMKRRLEIARGLLHHPRVLFLDEPTVGLDPQTRGKIWQYLHQLRAREDITIFLTTHYMEESEACDRVAIIDAGRIVALSTPLDLKARTSQKSMNDVFLHLTGKDIREEPAAPARFDYGSA